MPGLTSEVEEKIIKDLTDLEKMGTASQFASG